MEHTISLSECFNAHIFIHTHELDRDLFGDVYDTPNNRIYEKSLALLQGLRESAEAEQAAKKIKDAEAEKAAANKSESKPAQNPANKKGRSLIPKNSKYESYYYDVKQAKASGNDYALKELFCEALEKGNAYARRRYLQIYEIAAEGRRARS